MQKENEMAKKGRAWKMERASVSVKGKNRARSNKYRKSTNADPTSAPKPGTRKKFWVGGYHKKDGTYVRGHYRKNPHFDG